MLNFYLLKFNNYYNREEKKFDNIVDYLPFLIMNVKRGIVNWTPADGIDATWKCNLENNDIVNPDYLVITDDTNQIQSRWFIVEADQLRGQQYQLKLHRDVVADNLEAILDSPCYVEKAIVPDSNDLIFNTENMTYNQIKKKEILLKDESDTAWIVGYTARDLASKTHTMTIGSNYDVSLSTIDHDDWEFYANRTTSTAIRNLPEYVKIGIRTNMRLSVENIIKRTLYFDNLGSKEFKETTDGLGFSMQYNEMQAVATQNYPSWFNMTNIIDDMRSIFNYANYSNVATLLTQYNGKRVLFNDGVYRVIVKEISYNANKNITIDDGAIYTTDLYPIAKNGIEGVIGREVVGTAPYFTAEVTGKAYYVQMYKLSEESETLKWTLPAGRNRLSDAPYDMFAIPFNQVFFGSIPGGTTYTQLEDVGKMVAADIAVELSAGASGELYDIQILPYCPFDLAIQSSNTLSTLNLTEHTDYELITDSNDTPVGIILFPTESSFSTTIYLSNTDKVVIQDYKVESECDLYRLCSPNYTGVFEFNAAKNGGITYFEVNCTYKPYNPYIHLNPNFGRLYGGDFNDERGLICGGDFSMAIVNDAWVTYELNNKNYEKSFQRNITSLELQNKYATIRDVAGAVSGTVGAGTMSGMQTGSIGAGIGAGAISGVAGAADVYMNMKLRRENINLQKDQFSYSLQNIKALPYTLSRTTSYTINNKYFPFLEYYTCSEVEKEALRNKIKYEGMTVMAIGKMRDYLSNEMQFFKGRMIKIIGENYYEESHMSEEINNRISQGIYIGG